MHILVDLNRLVSWIGVLLISLYIMELFCYRIVEYPIFYRKRGNIYKCSSSPLVTPFSFYSQIQSVCLWLEIEFLEEYVTVLIITFNPFKRTNIILSVNWLTTSMNNNSYSLYSSCQQLLFSSPWGIDIKKDVYPFSSSLHHKFSSV